MDALTLLQNPLVVVGLAIAIFVARVLILAKRLKSAAANPTLADVRALAEAKKFLDKHKESLRDARGTMTGNLEGARDTLRHYRKPLDRARSERREAISGPLKHEAFEEAKALYRTAKPRPRRAATRRDAPKDMGTP